MNFSIFGVHAKFDVYSFDFLPILTLKDNYHECPQQIQ